MSNKGYVATAGGFCVAISTTSRTKETNAKDKADGSNNTATESTLPSTRSTVIPIIKKSA